MNRNILLVGPRGFLARHVIQQLSAEEQSRLVTLGTTNDPVPGTGASFSDLGMLKQRYASFDTIYLLGAYIPYGSFLVPHTRYVQTNVVLVASLSQLYPEARIVFASSVSVYGLPTTLPVTLQHPFNQPDLYGMSKLAGEAIIRNHRQFFILRFSSLLGRGMKPATMVPRMVEAALQTGKITVYGDGSRDQNYLDVRDAAQMCLAAATLAENGIALGVGTRSYSNRAVAEIVQGATGATVVFQGQDSSPSFEYDAAESYRMLNFAPRFTLEQTIVEMIR
jgi:UDP-glucose 4-epimerase